MRKKLLFYILIANMSFMIFAQQRFSTYPNAEFVDDFIYQPNYELMQRAAELQTQRNEAARKAFVYYQDLAYQSLNRGNKFEFITLSNTALSYGWHNSKLYYDRGLAYRDLGNKKQAKKELKKSKKSGHPISNKTIKLILDR